MKRLFACALALGIAATPASATKVEGGTPLPAARIGAVPMPVAGHPPEKLELLAGTITAVDLPRRSFVVNGVTVSWDASQLRIFRPGGMRGSEQDLRSGVRIRFAREPGAGDARRVVLIHLEPAR